MPSNSLNLRVLQQRAEEAPPRTWAKLLGGGLLAGYGLSHRSLTGLALTAAGGALLYRAARELTCRAGTCSRATGDRPDQQIERSRVDEASWESFPASDPPAY